MIIGVGVDIVEVAWFEKMAAKPPSRIFTQNELAYLNTKGSADSPAFLQSMAGLFAAKEAVAKALGTGFTGFWPCDIEIKHDNLGKPRVTLHQGAKGLAGKKSTVPQLTISISISHTTTNAIAYAIAER